MDAILRPSRTGGPEGGQEAIYARRAKGRALNCN
jgi:hypothetical protein